MGRCSDNTRIILATGIPAVIAALAFSFLPRDYSEVLAFTECTKTFDRLPDSITEGLDDFKYCSKLAGETSVNIYIAMLVICAVFVVLGIVFAILNCLSCGASSCMKLTGNILVSIGLMCLADLMVILITVYVVADNDISGDLDMGKRSNLMSSGTYSLYQLAGLGLAWLVVCIVGPFLTCTGACWATTILWVIGAVISFAIIAIIVACNPHDVAFTSDGAKAMGCVLGVWDAVIFSVMCVFCFCCAKKRGCCCKK